MRPAPASAWIWAAVIVALVVVLSIAGQSLEANGLDHPAFVVVVR